MPPRSAAGAGGGDAINIGALLAELGYDTPAASARARAVLQAAGLTRAGKQGIAAEKRERARAAIAAALIRVCGACTSLARQDDAREPVATGRAMCEVCGGSDNQRAALECAGVMRANGVTRLLVIGGAPGVWRELADTLKPHGIEIDIVDGTQRSQSRRDAIQRMNRAQLMIIWGSTELRHAISSLYTEETPPHLRTITVARRGVAALCNEVVRSFRDKPAAR